MTDLSGHKSGRITILGYAGKSGRNAMTLSVGSVSMTLPEWSEKTGIAEPTIRARIKNGWSPERVVGTPTRKGNYRRKK
jgi:hypothetical protein